METFTRYVRDLENRGGQPRREDLDAVWRALRDLLRREIQRRGLWDSWPGYFGIYGWSRWYSDREGRPGGVGGTADALDELTADCYKFVFLARLQSLSAQLKQKPNVEGLIRLAVRHFLFERQRSHDPLGYCLFELLREALRGLCEAAILRVWSGAARIGNDSVLAFSPTVTGVPAQLPGLRALASPLAELLIPEALTARGTVRQALLDELRGRISDLATQGVEAFRFVDLIEPVKRASRERWNLLLSHEGLCLVEGDGQPPGAVLPQDLDLIARDSFAALDACVRGRLAGLRGEASKFSELERLWRLLVAAKNGERGEVPSLCALARLAGLSRRRVSQRVATLRELVQGCRDRLGSIVS